MLSQMNDNLNLINNTNLNISTKEDLLMSKLTEYYYNNENISRILDIIHGYSNISLRVIDWFVTNNTKKIETIYNINNKQFNVHAKYKNKLNGYQKKLFDPFQRRDRIKFYYNTKKDYIVTTVGQLNFFRWAIENNILEYIQTNLKTIEKDMNISLRKSAEKKKKTNKRQELSASTMKKVNKHNIKITLSFD